MSSMTACRSAGSGDSNSIRRPSAGWVNDSRAECRNGRSSRCTARSRRRRAGGRRRTVGSPTIGCPMAFRWTRIWCVRPVEIATWISDTPRRCRGHVTRVTALRARRARVDIFCRCCGSRPIGASMRLPGVHHTPDQRDVFLLDLAVVELARQLLVRRVVLGHHHHSRRAAIEPVHDARPQLAADAAQILDVMEQRVHQRAAAVARRRVHHHPRRLVDARRCRSPRTG